MNENKPKRYQKSYEISSSDSILGMRIKSLMNSIGINQNQLADAMGVSKATVSTWMKADSIQSCHLVKLAEYFKVTTDYLLGLSNTFLKDPDIKSICDSTGLSDMVVIDLMAMNDVYPERIQSLNALLSNSSFYNMWDLFLRAEDSTLLIERPWSDTPAFRTSEVFMLAIQKILFRIHDQFQQNNPPSSFDEIDARLRSEIKERDNNERGDDD